MSSRHVVRRIACLSIAIHGSIALAATPPAVEWTRHVATDRHESFDAVAATGLGGAFIAKTAWDNTGSNAGVTDARLLALDSTGGTQWSREFGVGGRYNGINSIWADGLGHAYVGGHARSRDSSNQQAILQKYDVAGNVLWTRHSAIERYARYNSIAGDGSGAILAAGTERVTVGPGSSSPDGLIAKFDLDGNLVWERTFGGSLEEWVSGAAFDPGGNIFVAGNTANDAFVAKFDSSGNQLWLQQFGTSWSDNAESVAADDSGNAFVVGILGNPANPQSPSPYIRKIDGEGNLLWSQTIGEGVVGYPSQVIAAPGGGAIVTGQTEKSLGAGAYNAFVHKYDSAGALVWSYEVAESRNDFGADLSFDQDGGLFVVGRSRHSALIDAWVARLAPDAATIRPGDFNVDGVVDGADFLRWQLGESPAPLSAADLAAWKQHFGHPGVGVGAATIPEPSGVALVVAPLASLALLRCRQRGPNVHSDGPRRNGRQAAASRGGLKA